MESQQKTMKITVLRYRPEQDKAPWEQTFDVPYHKDTSVLEALFYIKDNFEPSLSFRWSCRMAVCGSCGMMVNGVPHLACKTFLRDYEGKDMKIEPLANFPIEQELQADSYADGSLLTVCSVYQLRLLLRSLPTVQTEP